jgi:hypothetical protein
MNQTTERNRDTLEPHVRTACGRAPRLAAEGTRAGHPRMGHVPAGVVDSGRVNPMSEPCGSGRVPDGGVRTACVAGGFHSDHLR